MTTPLPRKRCRATPPSFVVDQVAERAQPPSVIANVSTAHGDGIADPLRAGGAAAVAEDEAPAQLRLNIDYVDVGLLTPASEKLRRAGKHLQERLQRNVRRFGIVRPILARRRTRSVIAGHSILEAAQAVGLTKVPVVYIDHLSDDEVRVLRISLHKIESLSSWDEDALKVELEYFVEVDPG